MNALRIIIGSAVAGALLMLIASCATPERINTLTTYHPNGNVATAAVSRETGFQLFIGERKDAQTPQSNESGIGKDQMGAVSIAAIGAVAGAYLGGMPGAVLGGAGGAAVGALGQDKEAEAPADVDALLNPQSLGAMSPAAREALKAYIRANPEKCRLCQVIGQENVFLLIDRLGAQ